MPRNKVYGLKVNEKQWNACTPEEQKKIFDGLVSTGTLKVGDKIEPDPSAPPIDSNTTIALSVKPMDWLCETACDVAAAAAFAWCEANTGGAAYAACIAAAEAARQECKRRC